MNSLIIISVGDLMLADQPLNFGFGIRSIYGNDYRKLIADEEIVKILKKGNIVCCNLESSYNDSEKIKFVNGIMTINRKAVCFIKEMGFNLVNLANNHTLENGEGGLRELVNVLEEEKIRYTGMGNKYAKYVNGNKEIAVLGYNMLDDYKNTDIINLWNEEKIKEIKDIVKQNDFTVVNMHWGFEFFDFPVKEQIFLARKLIDEGVNLILGHHSHVLQPIEKYKNGLIVYSMGNFIFDYIDNTTKETAIFEFNIDLDTASIRYEIYPICIKKDFSIGILEKSKESAVLSKITAKIYTEYNEVAYKEMIISKRNEYRKKGILHILFSIFRYKDKYSILKWIIKRVRLIMSNIKREKLNPQEVYKWN